MNAKQFYCRTCGQVHTFGRMQASPRPTWQQEAMDGLKEAGEVIITLASIIGLVILLATLWLGLPFLVWLIGGAA